MPAAKLLNVRVANLVPNPENPKSRTSNVDDLVQSIAEIGLLQPIPVYASPGKKHRLIAGHRRLAAVKKLGWKTVDVVVHPDEPGDDGQHEQLLRMVAENEVREDLSPMEEAALVRKLMAQVKGATYDRVGKVLGHSTKWVARRANLSTLTPKWQKAAAGDFHMWPPQWLEEVALLSPKSQDALLANTNYSANRRRLAAIESYAELRRFLGQFLHTLKHAPWDLADEGLVARSGSCADCPKTSCSRPGLFGAFSEKPKLEAASCTDSECWKSKHGAWLRQRVEAAQLKFKGQKVVLLDGKSGHESGGYDTAVVDAAKLRRGDVLSNWRWELRAEKNGGKPGVIVSGRRLGETVFFGPARATQTPAKRAATKPNKTVAEKRKLLKQRRDRKALEELEVLVRNAELSGLSSDYSGGVKGDSFQGSDQTLLDLLFAFGTARRAPILDLPHQEPGPRRVALFEEVRDRAADAIEVEFVQAKIGAGGSRQLRNVEHLVACFGLDLDAVKAKVAADMPEPKSWAAATKAERAKPVRKKKVRKKKAARRVRPLRRKKALRRRRRL